MQTPEEFAWTLYGEMNHRDDEWTDEARVVKLIAERDKEVAEHARVNKEWWRPPVTTYPTIPGLADDES